MKTALLLAILATVPVISSAQKASVTGKVIDDQTSEALPGANIILALPGETLPVTGTTTDFDGMYRLDGVDAGSYDLIVRYIGYSEYSTPVELDLGATLTMNVNLLVEGVSLNTVIVTASRQQEKILDAPASITVLQAREIEEQPTPGVASTLRNVTGVDMAQTGAERFEIVMRGFNNAFSGAAYTLVDYRQGAIPSLAVNAYFLMPISNIDIDRIEVVRGPGSALYGAGVDAGVIHMVTKDPFTSPGTTVALLTGERNLAGASFRHAGVVGSNVGYKITGLYTQVDDWELDPFDLADFEELDANGDGVIAHCAKWTEFRKTCGESSATFYEKQNGRVVEVAATPDTPYDIERDYETYKFNLNGMLEYRLSTSTSLTINGGHQRASSPSLTGVGTAQADGFGYSFGQLRLRSGPFFAQAYYNQNRAGDSYVYGTGADFVDRSNQFNAQAQYDLTLANGRERLIVGADFENTSPDTEGTIYGRNEDDDKITEYGAYAQSTTQVSPKIDLTVAGRLDYNNIQEEILFSPRAAVVYKPAQNHSLRVTYNRAFSSPGNNSLFLDIVADKRSIAPGFVALVRGRGSRDGFTFRHDPSYVGLAGSDLVATSILPSPDWNQDTPVGAYLNDAYWAIYGVLSQLTAAELGAALGGVTIPEEVVAGLKQLLHPTVTVVEGFAPGILSKEPLPVEPLKQTTSETFEVGYKGLINNRFLVAVDVYRSRKENFVGPLLLESPLVLVPDLLDKFQPAFATAVGNNALLTNQLAQLGYSPEALAAIVTALASGSFEADTPVGIVQPAENLNPPQDPAVCPVGCPEFMLAYRNFGEVDFWGADIAAQVIVTSALSVFGSISYVSDGDFSDKELGEPGSGKEVKLNAPERKFKAGFSYDHRSGLTVTGSARWTDEFNVASGPYVGVVPDYFLLDLGVGYDLSQWAPGLRIDVLSQNVLDEKHREFVGAPMIGRFTTARVTYSL